MPNNLGARQLYDGLLRADTESEVIEILKEAGYWDDPAVWRFYGDQPENWATVGNQQSRAEQALIEKAMNAIDTKLIAAACIKGVPLNGPDAPQSVFEAACERENIPLVTVHDCFGTLGCHVDALREIWLRELRTMYENSDVLRQIYNCTKGILASIEGAPAPLGIPKPRGLDLKDVNGPYALS